MTSYSLLARALDLSDQGAWEEVCSHYEKFIYYLLHQLGVDGHDIDDVTQKVYVTLTTKLKTYDRERSPFRPWLKKVVTNATYMHFRQKQAYMKKIAHYREEGVHLMEGRAGLEELVEAEWRRYITSLAKERVFQSYSEQAVEAFELGMKGVSTSEVAEALGMQSSSVYSYRNRIKKSMVYEVRNLIEQLEGE